MSDSLLFFNSNSFLQSTYPFITMKLLAVSLEEVNYIIFAFVDLFSECPGLFFKKYIFNIL